MHDKLLHSGDAANCPICMQLRRGRPLHGSTSRVMDVVPGRTWSMDAIVWSNRGKWGEKLTVGAIDERSMYGIHTELSCKTTEETAEAFVTMVKQLREDPVFGRPDLFTRVNLDSAGEWGSFNAEFHKIVKRDLQPPVQFIYPQGAQGDVVATATKKK